MCPFYCILDNSSFNTQDSTHTHTHCKSGNELLIWRGNITIYILYNCQISGSRSELYYMGHTRTNSTGVIGTGEQTHNGGKWHVVIW